MRRQLTITALLLIFFMQTLAQRIIGKVIDKITGQPVISATIKSDTFVVFTRVSGDFVLSGMHMGDSIYVTSVGYIPSHIKLSNNTGDTLRISLQPASILLKSVAIKATRDYHADSLKKRSDFADAFNYRAPGIMSAFIKKGNAARTINTYNIATNSTTDLVGINLISVVNLLKKNKNQKASLQKMLIKDEEADYINHLFSKLRVMEITALKGDSLQNFMVAYRPTMQQAKKMNTNEVTTYIKANYADFLKTYRPGNFPFWNSN